MDFTIVTPSYRQLDWLACCIASVADQEGVAIEHIVQDAGSEGFSDFSERMKNRWPDRSGYRRYMISEKDEGMYEAINRGLQKGSGRICAYLNCDEQYLPGALREVCEAMGKNPQAEILYGGFLVVNPYGKLVTLQKPVRLFWPHLATCHLANFSCATFFRRSLLSRDGAWFNPASQACGDAQWNLQRISAGTPSLLLNRFLGTFRETGQNRGLSPQGLKEREQIRCSQPAWVRAGVPLWKAVHRTRKFLAGGYFPQRLCYSIWQNSEDPRRKEFGPQWAYGVWSSRLGY